jgi:FkbM family methyltransferase
MIIATSSDLMKLQQFYFVEFGATDGISISNTYLFEKFFQAQGIVSEPARIWRKELEKNRQCCISNKCVWEKSGEKLEFIESTNPDLSGLAGYDGPIKGRETKEIYEVDTISLDDLLQSFAAPKSMNFLSIDTEGSELKILSNFNFQKFQFDVIVCEHNYGQNREEIRQLLESNGYKRKHKFASFFDDWYFLEHASDK